MSPRLSMTCDSADHQSWKHRESMKAESSHNSLFQAKPRKKMCRLRLRAQDDLGTFGVKSRLPNGSFHEFLRCFCDIDLGQIWSDLLGGVVALL